MGSGKGYMGKVLWVNLGTREIKPEDIPEETIKKYMTGYGLGAKILYDNIPPGADALGPENILGFCSGILTGTPSLFSGRWMVVAKSPLTGGWGDANCGGTLAPAIKRSGYDCIFFTGVSEKPVYLYVDDEKAELRDASGLWGKDIVETEDAILEELGEKKLAIASIGPAGEKLSLIAGIANDRGRYAGRSGVGAVMGSKKLKALVAKGKQKVTVDNAEQIKSLTKSFRKGLDHADLLQKILGKRLVGFAGKLTRIMPAHQAQAGDLYCQVLKKYGTMGITSMSAESGDSPVKNWGGAGYKDFPLTQSSKISDDAVLKYQSKRYSCHSCPIGCGGIMEVKDGPYPLEETHKPEYETLCAFGTLCLVDDIHVVLKANDMCNRGGLDTISAGGAIAFAIECYENGILTKDDLGGLEIGWGKAEPIIQLLQMIIDREGIGDVLADGVKVAAQKIGKDSDKYAIHAGGQELPMHDGKFDTQHATAYEAEPTPGRHTISAYVWQELMQLPRYSKDADKIKPMSSKKEILSPDGKAKNQAINSKIMQVVNGAGLCMFGLCCGPKLPLYEWLNATTGWGLTDDDYLTTGERIETLRHSFNVREGITHKDTKMNARARGDEPLTDGPLKGVRVDVDEQVKQFYREFDWDYETGKPSKERLEALGLNQVLKDFYG